MRGAPVRPIADTRLKAMPAAFLEWQCDERRKLFEGLARGQHPTFLPAHLPVVSTINCGDAAFPIRSSTKGVGLLPKAEHLTEYLSQVGDCLTRVSESPPQASRGERIAVAEALYGCSERIDRGLLGSLEIFRGQTYRNLRADPRATLLFTGAGPRYLSYQFNCTVEIVGPADQRFLLIRAMRLLFEMERFHIQQPEFSVGYLFHVQEVYDKTPHRVKAR